MKGCKNCGEINENDAEFCCNCGKNAFVFSEETACPFCGAANDKSYTHCINCGNAINVPVEADKIEKEDDSALAVDLRAELATVYNSRLSEVIEKETAKCPNCGAEIQINAVYCYKCGTNVASLHEHRVVKRKICPHCGRPNLLSSPYCTYCYGTLAEAKSEEYQVIHESKQIGNSEILQTFLSSPEGKKKICNNCGTMNRPEEEFCVNCGLKLDMEEQKMYCVNCGAENDAGAKFCTKCQWSFDGTSPDETEGAWTCEVCKQLNGKENDFCVKCGAKKVPAGKGGKK